MSLWIGTSGFSYKHWQGVLYPERVSSSRYLEYYAQSFSTVEINVSFYHTLSQTTIQTWRQQTPDQFRFAIKAPRTVTHLLRLAYTGELMLDFAQTVSGFGYKMGPVLVQLPPNLHADPSLLQDFLNSVPDELNPLAFEFRHESWFVPAIAEMVQPRGTVVAHDYGGREAKEIVPGRIAYYRLHGPGSDYSNSYPEEFLRLLAQTVLDRVVDDTDVYVYFNNDIEGHAVRNAMRLIDLTAPAG
jgi:uncharacterized protein YecE (DUF72 family)